jgi:hypothetical protein
MAVTVLLVVLVIGAVVGIVYAAYSWFGNGTSKLTDTVTSIDRSAYSQYDDAQVTGSDVLSALKTYRESDISIFISNNSMDGYENYSSGKAVEACNYCSRVYTKCGTNSGNAPDANDSGNYVVELSLEDDTFSCADFIYDSSKISTLHNTNFSPTTTTSNTQAYVKQSAKWYAKLVYSETTNDVAGILFMQMN